MPDRIIRAEIWESDRFLDLSSDSARLAFIRFLSLADDFGNFEGGARRLYRDLVRHTQVKTEAEASSIVQELVQVDLIRRYEVVDNEHKNVELFHIPRFRTGRNYIVRKVYKSPWDDPNLELGKNKRFTNQGIAKNLPEHLQTFTNISAGVGVGVGVGEVLPPNPHSFELDEKRRGETPPHPHPVLRKSRANGENPRATGTNPRTAKPVDDWWKSNAGIDRKGRELGLRPGGTESYELYRERIRDAIRNQSKK